MSELKKLKKSSKSAELAKQQMQSIVNRGVRQVFYLILYNQLNFFKTLL